jgi:DNA-binding SARP family transcriptional activator
MDQSPSASSPDTPQSTAGVLIQSLGRLQLVAADAGTGDKSLLDGGKPLALLLYLACSPARQARRDQLIDLLWADLEPDAAKHALRQTLWYIKKRAGDGLVLTAGDTLRLTARVAVDRDALEAAAESGESERVVELYTGDFLPGFAAPGGAEFEAWADLERRRLRAVFVRAVESTTRELLRQGKVREAVVRARRARAADASHQASWRLLLEALLAAREWTQALVECEALERQLAADEVAAEPATRALMRAARQGALAESPGHTPETPPVGLAVQLVGREREFASLLDAVAQVQRGRGRHVHLRAGAGLGKSRLLVDLHHRLRGARTRSLLVRCDLNGRELPYALASELALALGALPGARGISPGSASALVGMAPALSTNFPVTPDRVTGRESLRRRCQALTELAAAVSEDRPLVVLVDDIHWMDPDSRTVLGHLTARLETMRVLLVTAGRPVVEGRLEDPAAEELDLLPLTEAQVGELVASIATVGSDADGQGDANGWGGRLVHELWRSAGGSPLLVVETLQLLGERGLLVAERGEWRAVDLHTVFALLRAGGALARRIDALPRDQRWFLTLLSVAGFAVSEDILRDAAGAGPAEAADALQLLERRGLVARTDAGWVIGHDEMAMTVLERTTSEGLRAAHVALGRRLWQDAGADVTDAEAAPAPGAKHGRPAVAAAGPRASVDLATLRRAAQHLVQGGQDAPRDAVFLRFVRRMRALGDARPLHFLAEDLLGRHASAAVVRELVGSLPWHVRLGLTSTRRVAAAAAAIGAVALLPASYALVRAAAPTPSVPVAELLVVELDGEAREARRAPIISGEWIPGRPIQAEGERESIMAGPLVSWPVIEDPTRRATWYVSRSVTDSGVIDLFAITTGGERRLTTARGDDMLGDISPDGRYAAIATGRWNADSHYDIAIVDLSTGAAQGVTRGDNSDQHPRWSHGGDRLAFVRRSWEDDTQRLCLVNPDGSDLTCPKGWIGVGMLAGWIDEEQLLVTRDAGTERQLAVASIRDSSFRMLDETTREAPAISPDGRWVACVCERFGYDADTWFVMPVGRRAEARPVTMRPGVSRIRVAFSSVGRPAPIRRLEIDVGFSSPAVGVPHRLSARGVVGERLTKPLLRTRWSSSDPSILAIDSLTGEARPRLPGRVMVRAALPGWTTVERPVDVRADVSRPLLEERWDSTWAERWVDFGTPRPVVVRLPDRARLNVNGDGSFRSGALSRQPIDGARGLSVDATLAVRITKPQWQVIALSLVSAGKRPVPSEAERAMGALDSFGAPDGNCGVQLPAGEGVTLARKMLAHLGATGVTLPIPEDVAMGRRVAVRLQLLPDGRCGIAVDGRQVFLSESRLSGSGQVQVLISGNAHETEATVGAVQLWTGVRPGVAWQGR